MNKKCKNCKGFGFVQIGPNVRGLKECPICKGKKVVNASESTEKRKNTK